MLTMQNDIRLILDDPLDGLALVEIHGIGYCRWKVYVPLIRPLLTLNELNLSGETHNI